MRLQLALDSVDIPAARALLDQVIDLLDIVEIGTPVILREGIRAVTEVKKAFPNVCVVADLKIMDAGDYEARIALDAGADIVTVLGAAYDVTIMGAIDQAHSCGGQVLVDMIAVKDLAARAREVEAMGADIVCAHTASDFQGRGEDSLQGLSDVASVLDRAELAVAGGINPDSLRQIIAYRPGIVIVGSYITDHPDYRQAALNIREMLA